MMKLSLVQFLSYLSIILAAVLLTGCGRGWADNIPIPKQLLETINQVSAYNNKHKQIIFEEPDLQHAENPDVNNSGKDTSMLSAALNHKPRIAIIIDDMGFHHKIGDELLALDLNLSFSFLPHAPFTLEQEEKAYQLGRDILVHLPMEASDPKWDPGPGGLYLSASTDELTDISRKNIDAVPHAIGANNHMGSKLSRNRQAMHTVLAELKRRGLFFVDSVTTGSSIGMDEARKMGIKTNRRNVFLDNVQQQKEICNQLNELTTLAGQRGYAIGIGHPHQATLDALRKCRKKLLETVQIVPVHELVE